MKKSIIVVIAVLGMIGLFGISKAEAYQGKPGVQGPNCTAEQHAAVEKAIESNNYQEWKKLMTGKGRVTQVVNESNFSKFAEMHKFMDQGNTAEAQKIQKELGLGLRNGSGKGMGQGLGRNR